MELGSRASGWGGGPVVCESAGCGQTGRCGGTTWLAQRLPKGAGKVDHSWGGEGPGGPGHPAPAPHQTPYFWMSTLGPATELDYAIYLAKKNIRKQGALVGHEKEHYDQLHRKMSHAWDLVVVQAREQLRAAKQCRKGDRLVIACQERTYWLVNRPPPGVPSVLEQGPERRSCAAGRAQLTQSPEFYRQEVERCRKALARARVKSSVCLEAYLNFSSQRGPHDPLLSGCLPSNPWVTDEDTYWTVNAPSVAVPTKLRVERWGFSFQELLGDPVGRAHFLAFLGTEFSAENLSFWEACEELRYGGQAQVPALVDSVYQQFLAPGAARWVNVDSRTMERTLAGLRRPHRYVLDDAQLHIYMLMKKCPAVWTARLLPPGARLFTNRAARVAVAWFVSGPDPEHKRTPGRSRRPCRCSRSLPGSWPSPGRPPPPVSSLLLCARPT
ncbi:regulator of G-protein signaling 11 isoform X8 [Vulpes lagopus]|uniref:regulator of G-protein signaling 11 isoform X8 n=1 Tax=Vulpes lagopus TaxID=494514 RepID=UPI001BC95196|nr:regulator of G-protein signaling 11 isoform X8 [Vulpes lagopus]